MAAAIKLLILSVLFLNEGGGSWKRIHTEQQISFLFPNHEQRLEREIDSIVSHIYQTKDQSCVYGVVCSDFSSAIIPLDSNNMYAVYELLKEGSINQETLKLKGERTIPDEQMLIQEIEYTIMKDKYEMTYFKRFIFRGHMAYQISIGGRSRHRDIILKQRDIFFNSVYFSDTFTP